MPLPQAWVQWPAIGSGSRSARRDDTNTGWLGGLGYERLASAHDLVETMHYLYVRVVKARGLPHGLANGGACCPNVEVRVGNHHGATRRCEGTTNPEWNQVFAFSRDRVQATALEVLVRDKGECIGRVAFDVGEALVRVPPDSPLTP